MSEIMVANATEIHVGQEGAVGFATIIGNQRHSTIARKVYSVPNLKTNLLSVSQLIENGNKVVFENDRCNCCSELIGIADLFENVYKLNVDKTNYYLSPMAFERIWHKKFGHLNLKDLHTMEEEIVEDSHSQEN